MKAETSTHVGEHTAHLHQELSLSEPKPAWAYRQTRRGRAPNASVPCRIMPGDYVVVGIDVPAKTDGHHLPVEGAGIQLAELPLAGDTEPVVVSKVEFRNWLENGDVKLKATDDGKPVWGY